MKRGFTLIELMVASLLLGMLVTVLTMVFNQSSIAWRTGVAGVADLRESRWQLSDFHDVCDDLLPGVGEPNASGGASDNRSLVCRTGSLWQENGDGLRIGERAHVPVNWGKAPGLGGITEAMKGSPKSIRGPGAGQSTGLFTVGVRSAGPDRKFGTEDDVTTWPEDVE